MKGCQLFSGKFLQTDVWSPMLAAVGVIMSSYVLNLLGYLASKTLQERYVIEGTTKEYIVLEQLVEDAYYFTKHPITLMRGYDTLKLKLVLDNLNIDEGQKQKICYILQAHI